MKIPENTNLIADGKIDRSEYTEEDIASLQLGMQFFADMLNRLSFLIAIIAICLTFGFTFVKAWAHYDFSQTGSLILRENFTCINPYSTTVEDRKNKKEIASIFSNRIKDFDTIQAVIQSFIFPLTVFDLNQEILLI